MNNVENNNGIQSIPKTNILQSKTNNSDTDSPPKTKTEIERSELTEQEQACQEFVETNKQSVPEALTNLIKDKQFVLIGEHHSAKYEPVRHEIAIALAKLQQNGLTHLALEQNAEYQNIIDNLDYSDPKIKQILKEKIKSIGWHDGHYNILIMAKLLGIKVVFIDEKWKEGTDTAKDQNQRDRKMLNIINSQIDDQSKMIIFIGDAHVHKKSVETYLDGRTTRLGTLLTKQYGNEAVSSVRSVLLNRSFDGLSSIISESSLTPEKISKGKKEVVILPDSGPIKGDERITATDYIITII